MLPHRKPRREQTELLSPVSLRPPMAWPSPIPLTFSTLLPGLLGSSHLDFFFLFQKSVKLRTYLRALVHAVSSAERTVVPPSLIIDFYLPFQITT